MIKNNDLSFEEYLSMQNSTRNIKLGARSAKKQSHYIRQHLAYVLTETFGQDYWVMLQHRRNHKRKKWKTYSLAFTIMRSTWDVKTYKRSVLSTQKKGRVDNFSPELKGGRGLPSSC